MTLARLSLAVLIVAASAVASAQLPAAQLPAAQLPVVVVEGGPGPTGTMLREVIANPAARLMASLDGTTVEIPSDSALRGPLLIIASRAALAGRVEGDVVMVGGDLFVHPGAIITGQAIAIGGAVYPSALAAIHGRIVSERDFTYDAATVAGRIELRYRPLRRGYGPGISVPEWVAVRAPTYDRSNGLSLPLGASLPLGVLEVQPTLTYRSQLGALDPALDASWDLDARTRVKAFAGRATLSNDRWIISDIMNSLRTIGTGHDSRNWYRAEHGSVRVYRRWTRSTGSAEPYGGYRWERAWSVRPDSFPTGGPWSFLGRKSADAMLRPNPAIDPGIISSAVLGANLKWDVSVIKSFLDIDIELPYSAPGDRRFFQATFDGQVRFPALWSHHFRTDLHAVVTLGDTAPRQRWAYLGRAGTISTIGLLELGGDHLLLIDSRYEMPFPSVKLPVVGSPSLMLRHVIGNAAPGGLPSMFELVGTRLSLGFLRAEVMVDTHERRPRFVVSLALTR